MNSQQIGSTVVIKNTMLYNGRRGTLGPASDDPEDFWDYTVTLSDGRRIGVTCDQFTVIG